MKWISRVSGSKNWSMPSYTGNDFRYGKCFGQARYFPYSLDVELFNYRKRSFLVAMCVVAHQRHSWEPRSYFWPKSSSNLDFGLNYGLPRGFPEACRKVLLENFGHIMVYSVVKIGVKARLKMAWGSSIIGRYCSGI